MASRVVRRCRHCREPLKATARSDTLFCSPACAQAERRWRRRFGESVEIGFFMISEGRDAVAVRCPVCGKRFIPGRGHRRDAIYDRSACRQAAYRDRRAQQPPREAVTPIPDVEPVRRGYKPLTGMNNASRLVETSIKDVRK
jgi:hypothetical protein